MADEVGSGGESVSTPTMVAEETVTSNAATPASAPTDIHAGKGGQVSAASIAAADAGMGALDITAPLGALWDELSLEQCEDIDPQFAGVDSVPAFSAVARTCADNWAALFREIPSDSEGRKDALKAAMRLKAAVKTLEALETGGGGGEPAAVTTETKSEGTEVALSAGPAAETPEENSILIKCQRSFRDSLHGLLDVSFPLDQVLASTAFKDKAATQAAFDRLKQARDLIGVLAICFTTAGVDPKETAEPKAEDSLPPELLKMLEKAMGEKKAEVVPEDQPGRKDQIAEWERTHGRLSCVVGKELYEGLCYRLAILDFMYIKSMIDAVDAKILKSTELLSPEDRPSELTVERFNNAIWHFENMMRAQGPVGSVGDNPSVWKPACTGPHTEETPRLFHHAIYSSQNLRALKHQAELCYWRWKYVTRSRPDAMLAALVNRKFVHIVRHIIPGRGWIADVEYDRVCEVEETLDTKIFSAELNKKPPLQVQAEKEEKKAIKGKGGNRAADSAGQAAGGNSKDAMSLAKVISNPTTASNEKAEGVGVAPKKKKGKKKK